LIDELVEEGIEAIEFCGGGEPTLYPYFREIVKYIANSNIELGILTNGSLLGKYYRLLIDNCIYVRVSIDFPHKNSYIANNLKKMTTYRNQTDSGCAIGIKSLVTKRNQDQVIDLIHLAKFIGADYIQFKGARSCKEELSPIQKVIINKQLRLFNNDFVKGDVSATKIDFHCFMSPIHTMIDAKGDVYICCYYQYRRGRHKIGNVIKNRFRDVWGSDRHFEVIENIKIDECNRYDCRFHYYNYIMKKTLQNETHINFI